MSDIVFVIITILFSAFFSGMEIAFISANRLKIELQKKQSDFSAKILSGFIQKPSNFIGVMLVGNNIAIVVYSILMAKLIDPYLHFANDGAVLLTQTLISTAIMLMLGEFLPKALFRINPNVVLKYAAIPLKIIYWILSPLTFITTFFSNGILKLFRIDTSHSELVFSKIDLEHFVQDIHKQQEKGVEIEHEIQIFKNALDFSAVKARECMIHRTEIIAMEINNSLDELREKFIETKLSKILIYRDTIDNIIGYVHSQELFKSPESIRSILLPIAIVPESMPVSKILKQLISQHRSLAVVVDEFGGTSGIITTEDIIEEIFGEIEDEHDVEELVEKQLNDNSFLFSAKTEIDYVNDKYKLNLPESEEYETLGGLIFYFHENIPEKGEIISLKGYQFKIEEVSNNRIELINLQKLTE